MGQIFISYSRRDTEIVDRIAREMESANLDVWIDREDIKAGNTWRVQIVQAIDTCLAFVLMLSPNSAASDNVRREIDLAQDAKGPFLPMLLAQVAQIPPEIRYQLAGQQLIDVQMLGLEKAVAQLIEIIKEHLKTLPPATEETRQVELVIQGIDLKDLTPEKQEQLLDFLAQLSNSDRSKLQLAGLAPGSIHAFVEMPSASAYQLKTLALNRDKRFKQFRIASLRLAGEVRFVHTSLGIPLQTATLSLPQAIWLRIPPLLRSTFGATVGKLLTVLLALLIIAGAGFAAAQSLVTPVSLPAPTISATAPPAATRTASPTVPPQPQPTDTFTPTATPTFTPSSTPTPTATATATETPLPSYQVLEGEILVENLSCRYGPGVPYLSRSTLISNPRRPTRVKVLGRSDTSQGVWAYVQFGELDCWVNANPQNLKLSGDVSSLEPYYPGHPDKFKLILFPTTKFPAPSAVAAGRRISQPDLVDISWKAFDLQPGDREDTNRPLYLLELWTCQGGQLVFTPVGSSSKYAETMSVVIQDEAGCSEPSHGRIYLSHKDGYVGPVEIPNWPAP